MCNLRIDFLTHEGLCYIQHPVHHSLSEGFEIEAIGFNLWLFKKTKSRDLAATNGVLMTRF